jgi:hypothetical protein
MSAHDPFPLFLVLIVRYVKSCDGANSNCTSCHVPPMGFAEVMVSHVFFGHAARSSGVVDARSTTLLRERVWNETL